MDYPQILQLKEQEELLRHQGSTSTHCRVLDHLFSKVTKRTIPIALANLYVKLSDGYAQAT